MLKKVFKISRSILSVVFAAQLMFGITGCEAKKAPIRRPPVAAPGLEQGPGQQASAQPIIPGQQASAQPGTPGQQASAQPSTSDQQDPLSFNLNEFIIVLLAHGLGGSPSNMDKLKEELEKLLGSNGCVVNSTERVGKTYNTSIEDQAKLIREALLHLEGGKLTSDKRLINAIKEGKKIKIILAGHSQGGPVCMKAADDLMAEFGKGVDFGENVKLIISQIMAVTIASPVRGVDINQSALDEFYTKFDTLITTVKSFGIDLKKEIEGMLPLSSSPKPGLAGLSVKKSTERNAALTEEVPTMHFTTTCSAKEFVRGLMKDYLQGPPFEGMIEPTVNELPPDFQTLFNAVFNGEENDGVVPLNSQCLPGNRNIKFNCSHLAIMNKEHSKTIAGEILKTLQALPSIAGAEGVSAAA